MWLHHGDNDTIDYVLEGEIRIEYGPGGRRRADIKKGDFFHPLDGKAAPWLEGSPNA